MANYYVHPTSGNNANSGAEGAPWQTIAYALATATTGDTVFLRGGANAASRVVYTERVAVTAGAGCDNGTSGSPITVTNYPGEYIEIRPTTGASSTHTFSITRNWWRFVFQEPTGADYYGLVDLQDQGSSGMAFFMDAAQDCLIDNVHIRNGNYYAMVEFRASARCEITDSLLTDNNAGAGSDASGVSFRPYNGDVDDCAVRRLTIYDMRGDCVVMLARNTGSYQVNRPIVEDSDLYTTIGGSSENAVDMKNCFSGVVRRNRCRGFRYCDGSTGGSGSGSRGGECFLLQENGGSVEVYNNTIYDISGPAMDFSGLNVGAGATVTFHHNLIYDLAAVDSPSLPSVFYVYDTGTGQAYFYNNTVYGRHGTTGHLIYHGALSVATLRNNGFVSTGDITEDVGYTRTYSNNGWYNAAETISGSGDVTSNPLMVDPAGDDYRIGAGSPWIDAGMVIAGITDGYSGAGPDIGYSEYSAPSVTAGGGATAVYVAMAYAPTWSLFLNDPNGVRLADLNAAEGFKGVRVEMGVGALVLTMPYDAVPFSYYKKDGIVELLRSVSAGSGPAMFAEQLYWIVGRRRLILENGQRVAVITCQDANRFLANRHVLYAAGTSQADKTDNAGDVMRAIVRENAGASAPAAYQIPGLTVGSDLGDGASVSKAFAWRNVLTVLQELAKASATAGTYLSFDLVATSHPGSGQPALEFRTYAGQRGLDHRHPNGAAGPVLLGPDFGTLTDADYNEDWADEINHVTALGPGQESTRTTASASDTARLGLSGYALAQGVVDARNSAATALQDEADAALRAGRPRRTFGAKLPQAAGVRFGIEIGFGDYLTQQAWGDSFDGRLSVVEFEYSKDGGERITPKLVNDGASDV